MRKIDLKQILAEIEEETKLKPVENKVLSRNEIKEMLEKKQKNRKE